MLHVHLFAKLISFSQVTMFYGSVDRDVGVCHGGSMTKGIFGSRGGRSQRDTMIHVTDSRTLQGIYIFSLVLQWP